MSSIDSSSIISRKNRREVDREGDHDESFLNSSFTRSKSNLYVIKNVLRVLVAHTAPSSLGTSWSGSSSMKSSVSSNHLSSLIDSHNIARSGGDVDVTRPFIETGGVRPIRMYRGLSVDTAGGVVMTDCCNPSCGSRLSLWEARLKYKSCHHCYTYYCGAVCRQADWKRHKIKECPMGRAASGVKAVVRRILLDEVSHNAISSLGRGGYLRTGRGCVVLWFQDLVEAETFSIHGVRRLANCPVYVSVRNIDILIARQTGNSLSSVQEACSQYDPDRSIVLNVSFSMDDATVRQCAVQTRHKQVNVIKKCVTISLSQSFLTTLTIQQQHDSLRPTSLLLTMLPGQQNHGSLDLEDRQIIFVHVLRKLESRGVDLRRQYPALYHRLAAFVETCANFSPTTIYPIDVQTGRSFVCMIAPMSDPITVSDPLGDRASSRSSLGSFMAELDAVVPEWEWSEVTDL